MIEGRVIWSIHVLDVGQEYGRGILNDSKETNIIEHADKESMHLIRKFYFINFVFN